MADSIKRLTAERDKLAAALEFYADPETYHAVGFAFDPPCGGFDEDFSEDEWTRELGYNRPMAGKLARETLQAIVAARARQERPNG